MEVAYKPKQYSFPFNWTEKQYFIYACFVEDLQVFYKDWIEQGWSVGRFQFFETKADGTLEHKYWLPGKICCESSELLTAENMDVKVGYWTPFLWKPIRKDLKKSAQTFEYFECQLVDKSCNDCKNLDRARSWCLKFDRETKIEPNLCHPQNKECFEHRRT